MDLQATDGSPGLTAATRAGAAAMLHLDEPVAGARPRARFVRVAGRIEHVARGAVEILVRAGERTLATEPTAADVDAGSRHFSFVIDLAGVAPGIHDLEVVARGATGAPVASATRSVLLDPRAAYAPLLASGERAVLAEDAPSLLVLAFGEGAEAESAARLSAVVADDLPGALRALLASRHDVGVLVEEPGAFAPGALAEIASAVRRHDGPDAVYGDDEWPGAAVPLHLKPAWSPELLLQVPYTGPLLAVGRAAAASALAQPSPPRTLHELLLGLDPALARVVHVCRPLFARERWARFAERAPADPGLRVPDTAGAVSVIVCTAHRRPELLDRCLRGLAADHRGGPLEVVLVDDGGPARGRTLALCEQLGLTARAVSAPQPFNFSLASNAGAAASGGSELLFLNDDVEPATDGWLESMRGWLQRPGVGVVGARLRYPGGRLQHAGVVVGPVRVDNVAGGWPGDWTGPGGILALARNTTAVTGACMLVDRPLFEALGGFDPALVIEFNDVDLPLRAALAGFRTVCAGQAELVHAEGATRGRRPRPEDGRLLHERWRELFADGDPFMHPGFDPLLDFEPAPPAPDSPRSREAPWSRGGCGLARRSRRRFEELEQAWAAAGIALAGHPGEAEGALAALQAQSRAAVAARDDLWQALGVIRSSRSWRATGPLRTTAARVRTRRDG